MRGLTNVNKCRGGVSDEMIASDVGRLGRERDSQDTFGKSKGT